MRDQDADLVVLLIDKCLAFGGALALLEPGRKNSRAGVRGSFHLDKIETSLVLRAIFVVTLDLSGDRLLMANSEKVRILEEHEDCKVTATYIARDGPKVDAQALSLFEDSFVTVIVGDLVDHIQVTK
jgi:hypothetical protein